MKRLSVISWVLFGLMLMSIVACTTVDTAVPTVTLPPTQKPNIEPEPTKEQVIVDFENELADLASAKFDDPTKIDNKWLPLKPGMQYIYDGFTEEAGEITKHRVIITITDLTKEIDGVKSIVSWDEDFSGDKLVETELAFYAQDNDGNVWRMGEYPEVYENNKLVEAPAWISGLKGAKAGIMMGADPQLDTGSFSQGWGPAVSFTDRWQVDQMDIQACVPIGCYEDVLVTAEFSQEEPDAFQLKYYAPGVGNVKIDWRGLDATRETLELVELIELTPESLAEARTKALELEARAYSISKEVYDQTSPSVGP